jgi:hypothetical protein
MTSIKDARGPIVVWENYGYEGWHPKSYATVKEALLGQRYNSEFCITRIVDFECVERGERIVKW